MPVNLARPVVTQLAEFGETRRGWLGVGIEEVTDEIAASLGRPNTRGALVVDVTRTGPADGVVARGRHHPRFQRPARSCAMRDLPRFVAETAVGEKVKVKVLRDGEEVTLDITLGRLEEGEKIIAAARQPARGADRAADGRPAGGHAPGLRELLGLDVGPIDEKAREAFDIGEGVDGRGDHRGRPGLGCRAAGLLFSGLVISEVNQQEVASVAETDGEGRRRQGSGSSGGAVQGDRPGGHQPVRRDQAGLGCRSDRARAAGADGPPASWGAGSRPRDRATCRASA